MMHARIRSSAVVATCVALVSVSSLGAQEGDAAPVLARFRTAVGANNLPALKTLRWVGVMQMPAVGVSAALTMEQGAPNRMLMTIEVPGMGAMRSGYDGSTAWSVDPMQGPRLLRDKELQDLSLQADLRALVRDPALLASARRGADTTIAGQPCTLVAYQWKNGREARDCFATATGLLIATMGKQATPGGEVEVVTRYTDYKPIAGVLIPHTSTLTAMGQEQIIKMEKVDANVPISDLQALPKEIVPLVKKP